MEFLKDLFGDQPLTYEQLAEAVKGKGLQVVDASAGEYVPKAQAETLSAQLAEANRTIDSFRAMDIDGVKKAAEEWKTKYQEETAALQQKLEEQSRSFTIKEAAAPLRFTSESARRAFLQDLAEKKLPIQDGKLLGMEDFVKQYREQDPGAFASEEPGRKPVAVRGGTGGMPQGKPMEQMTYSELCSFLSANPGAKI